MYLSFRISLNIYFYYISQVNNWWT